jgi:hypothetical protein
MTQVQSHGFAFEQWVKQTFFGISKSVYTQKWDVEKEHNSGDKIPQELRGIPVSIKTAKYGSPIGLGDAIRQFHIEEDFLFIVGFWIQKEKMEKVIVAAEGVKVSRSEWRNLWSPITLEKLKELDSIIKDYQKDYKEVRYQAKEMKKKEPYCLTQIVLNPKIDSKSQRRLQCSLPFKVFWQSIAKKQAYQSEEPIIFGEKVSRFIISPQRIFKKKSL